MEDICQQEQKIIDDVRHSVQQEALKRLTPKGSTADLHELREQAQSAHQRDLAVLLDQLHVEHKLASRDHLRPLPNLATPYFAHIFVDLNGKTREYLLGDISFLDSPVPIIDWKTAPMAKVYFQASVGEEFEIELPGGLTKGRFLEKRTLGFSKGDLLEIRNADLHIQRHSKDEPWEKVERTHSQFGRGIKQKTRVPITALLDPDQYRVLQTAASEPLLVLGSAGSGKTTIALHRLAMLNKKDPRGIPQNQIIVMVPEKGLARFTKKLLTDLELPQVIVTTFDDWTRFTGRKLLPALPQKICHTTPGNVIHFKRSTALLKMFPLLREKRENLIIKDLKSFLRSDDIPIAKGKSLLDWINNLESRLPKAKGIQEYFLKTRKKLNELQFERSLLFSNKEILAKVCELGHFPDSYVNAVYNHSISQMSEALSFDGVDAAHATTLDERSVNEDDSDSGTIDVEDYTILLKLYFYYCGQNRLPSGHKKMYRHVIIDEVQELGGLELSLIGHHLSGAITLAGDPIQKTDATSVFPGFDHAFEFLGFSSYSRETLQTVYRCSQEVVDFSRKVLGLDQSIKSQKSDPGSIMIDKVSSPALSFSQIIEGLSKLRKEEPFSSIALLFKDDDSAKAFYAKLDEIMACRLVEDGAFSFKPGIDICSVRESKGLEFDYVIISDLDQYSESQEDRQQLHVAVTRCIEQLWLIAVGSKGEKWI